VDEKHEKPRRHGFSTLPQVQRKCVNVFLLIITIIFNVGDEAFIGRNPSSNGNSLRQH